MSDIRVRRHTDGRVAIQVLTDRSAWSVVHGGGHNWVHERHVFGEGWSELLVAELPEPDGTERTSVGVERIKFGTVTATLNPDGYSSISNEVCLWDTDTARATAHALLAAVAACEHHRAQQ